jgi:hypothetical protein
MTILLPSGKRLCRGPAPRAARQRWDWQAQVYDYGASFYDPQAAGIPDGCWVVWKKEDRG